MGRSIANDEVELRVRIVRTTAQEAKALRRAQVAGIRRFLERLAGPDCEPGVSPSSDTLLQVAQDEEVEK
ncbi:MAG: hypothetical protein KY429_00590 [Actinobacteria bacterium]|nr:hypothetical protein [Actinomycetota bacterium]